MVHARGFDRSHNTPSSVLLDLLGTHEMGKDGEMVGLSILAQLLMWVLVGFPSDSMDVPYLSLMGIRSPNDLSYSI